MGGFDGRVALVTGAARGVGASCASLLSADGAAVGMIDVAGRPPPAPFGYPLASRDDMAGVLKLIDGTGGRAVVKEADVGRADELEPAIKEIAAELGPIELAVLAAGVRGVAAIDQMSDEHWAASVDANLHGVYNSLRVLLPSMVDNGFGRVVVLVGEEARRGAPNGSHCAAAGWAAVGLAKSVALEVADSGVSINVVAAGPTDTPSQHDRAAVELLAGPGAGQDAARHALETRNPYSSAYVDPSAVAETVAFLLARKDPAMTGGVVDVSNGLVALNSV